jgi:hypothetical protein
MRCRRVWRGASLATTPTTLGFIPRRLSPSFPGDTRCVFATFWRPTTECGRASLGHILIEILLDSILIDENPGLLDAYYRAMSEVDSMVVEDAVNRMATSRTERLSLFIPAFTRERFLCDYSDDVRLLRRLNQVMRRVGLPTLPETFMEVLPDARRETADRRRDLLPDF